MNLLQEQNRELIDDNQNAFETGIGEGMKTIGSLVGQGDTYVLFNDPNIPRDLRFNSTSNLKDWLENDAKPEHIE